MKLGSAIKIAMKNTNTTQKQMAERLGEKTQSVISQRLLHDNMSINLALEMLDVLGYEIVVQPKKRGRRPDGQILITRGDEE